MEKVIAVKVISGETRMSTRGLDDTREIVTRTLYVMYSDHTWEEFELHYNGTGEYGILWTYPKTFKTQNITQKKMTKEEVQKYIDEFEKSEGL